MARAYYNEIDAYAAAWLRNLISAGHIAPGDVDERSIVDVRPDDLKGYTQCHFFAGIGGWSYAARLAGWPDDRALWTGSCPCQPFSSAGSGKGQSDDRHLWPAFFSLIATASPAVVMGEQVAAAVGKHWLDGVCADLEGIGYSVGAVVVPACAVDAPHKRDRLWFVADTDRLRRQADQDAGGCEERDGARQVARPLGSRDGSLANALQPDQRRYAGDARSETIARGGQTWSTDGDASGGARDARSVACATGGQTSRSGSRKEEMLLGGLVRTGSQPQTEKPGALNPAFVSWLMGFPPEWGNCAPTAMQSSRKSRPK